jgi:nicotinamidase-related amidase
VGKLVASNTAFLLCDVQERFREIIHRMPTVIQSSAFLVDVSKRLGIPLVVTEHYQKVFGPTVQELTQRAEGHAQLALFQKRRFSMITEEVEAHLQALGKSQVVLFGLESHVCVMQTCLDLLERNVDVHLVLDAVSSQRPHDRAVAIERMRSAGAFVTTAESLMFQLLEDSDHPDFKELSKLLKMHNQLPNEFANDNEL